MSFVIHQGNALTVLKTMPQASVQCCITSPPYWNLRDYSTGRWDGGERDCDHKYNHGIQGATGQRADRTFTGEAFYKQTCWKCGASRVDQQLGMEPTPGEYIAVMVEVFREVRRVLKDDGTCWINIGDSYSSGGRNGHGTRVGYKQTTNRGANDETSPVRADTPPGLKPKDLVGIPWRLAFALQDDGWYLRADIIWHKNNPMPESVTDRPTKAHEYIFLFSKSKRYYYDAAAIAEPASLESHARYARGRSDTHKWADGGPGNQSIAKSFEGMRDRVPAGWHQGTRPATPSGIRDQQVQVEKIVPGKPKQNPAPGVHPKAAKNGSGIKANESFSAAVKDTVEFRNKRSVWTISTMATPEAHFATFPIELPEICLKAGCPEGGVVLDPFCGAGTTGLACLKNNRRFVGIELSAPYIAIAHKRARQHYPLFCDAPQVNSEIGEESGEEA